MGINVSTSMGFSNHDFSKNATTSILQRCSIEPECVEDVSKINVFTYDKSSEYTQLQLVSTSSMIALNNSLKETLKYLKTHQKYTKKKEPVFGELWNEFMATNAEEDSENQVELNDFTLDENLNNFFAA